MMPRRHLFLITRHYGSRDGGSRFIALLLAQAEARSIPVTIVCEAETAASPMTVRFLFAPALFQRTGAAIAGKLSAWVRIATALVRVGQRGGLPLVIVQGDLPRPFYLVLQLLVPTIFLRQDLFLTCPANDRFLPASGRVCARHAGLGCLWVNATEGCLRSLSPVRRIGRIALRLRDGFLYRRFRRFLAVSAYSSRLHLGRTGPYVHPYVCDTAEPGERSEASRFRLIFLGRLESVKGPEDALRVLAALPEAYSLDIAGSGSQEHALRRLASDLGVLQRVTFHGWIDHDRQAALLARSGLLLFPSRWAEAFGLSGVEAMAAGVPVVAYDVGGVSEWCQGDGGRTVPCGSVEIMRDEVLNLTGSEALWQVACAAARRTVAETFSRRHHLTQLRAHLPELLEEA